jgi:hypothetical protein
VDRVSPTWSGLQILAALVLWPHGTGAAEQAASVVSIDHKAVGCVLAGRFPRLEADVGPPAEVARVRVMFRATGTTAWYGVRMKPEDAVFSAALPKPKKSLTGFDYYIEVVDRAFTISRTQEYRPRVVGNAVACEQGQVMAVSLGSASVVVEAPAGAPALPGGFASAGVVTATAGGTGTVATVAAPAGATAAGGIGATALIVGGAAAAGAAVAVAAATTGEDMPTTTTTLPPTATGRWSGTLIENDANNRCTANWAIAMDLVESGGSLAGPMTVTGVSSTPGCAGPGEFFGPNPISNGTIAGTAVRWTFTFIFRPQLPVAIWNFEGVIASDRRSMSGTWTWPGIPEETGTWTATRQ